MSSTVLSRRQFILSSGAIMCSLSGRAFADADDGSKVQLGELTLGSSARTRPDALKRLAWEIQRRTSIDMVMDPAPVDVSRDLFRWPFLYLGGDQPFVQPSDADVARLRHHLQRGGFLLSDAGEGHSQTGLGQSVRTLALRLFPRDPLRPIDLNHVVYKSFYLLDAPVGRLLVQPSLEGIERDGRLVLVHCQNDFGGAWARRRDETWAFECIPGGEHQRELAFRLGINLVMYALCLDYKSDQVHLPFILRRRQWRR